MTEGLKIAIVGATGAVGQELRSILEQRKFPIRELIPFASSRSEGQEVMLGARGFKCQVLKKGCFEDVQIAFFDASDAVSLEWVMEAAISGAWVVDNSAAYRMEKDIPLVVPEVNGHLVESLMAKGAALQPRERVIAGPNCSTVQLVVPLQALHRKWGLKRVVVSSYQSTSGAGAAAMDELKNQTQGALTGKVVPAEAFTHQIAFNCIPHIGGFKDDGFTSEEHKIMQESRKILGLPQLRIVATAVRVPTLSCHGESVNVELERACTPEEARSAIRAQPGIVVQDDPSRNIYPMGLTAADDLVESGTGRDPVYVGRIRRDPSVDNGLSFWVVSDNLRKGAALNAVQIGEVLARSLR